MTHSGGKPHTNVGDRGQPWEIHGVLHDGTDEVFGWANLPEKMVSAAESWPRYKRAYAIHRGTGERYDP